MNWTPADAVRRWIVVVGLITGPLLLTLSSGVKGFTTIHASNARSALSRIRFLAELSESGRNLPHAALTTLVSDAVDLVVFSRRGPEGPRVTEIVAVEDLAGSPTTGAFTVSDVFTRPTADSELAWTGEVPARLVRFSPDVRHSASEPLPLLRW